MTNYIPRELEKRILEILARPGKSGLIVTGIVGCGKTTLIEAVLEKIADHYAVFQFSGDDTRFRQAVSQDTRHILHDIRSQTQRRSLVFVDEVQKSEDIFDAIKVAFDAADISFIISGSNPDYLNTQAKKRLQRRAELLVLQPFSLPEILASRKLIDPSFPKIFHEIILSGSIKQPAEKIDLGLALTPKIKEVIDGYLVYGGLPLACLAGQESDRLSEIQKVVERGFESLSEGNESAADSIRIELAELQSQEFSYQGLFRKTGLRRRDVVNRHIDFLLNHGYLVKKKPLVAGGERRSYLSVFSYVDPGIVTYLTGEQDIRNSLGCRIEGIAHTRLEFLLKNYLPLKSTLGYFKPYSIDVNDKVKFQPGEIDFLIKQGMKLIPIEVKATAEVGSVRVSLLRDFVRDEKLPLGVVLYKGVPYWDQETRLLYWPFWLV